LLESEKGEVLRQANEATAALRYQIRGLEDSLKHERDLNRRMRSEKEELDSIYQRECERAKLLDSEVLSCHKELEKKSSDIQRHCDIIDGLRADLARKYASSDGNPSLELPCGQELEQLLLRRLTSLERHNDELAERCALFEAEHPGALRVISELRSLVKTSDVQLQSLQASVLELTDKLSACQTSLSSATRNAETERQTLLSLNGQLSAQLSASQEREAQLASKLAGLTNDRVTSCIRRYGITATAQFTETVLSLEKKIRDLTNNVTQLEDKLAGAINEHEETRKQLAHADRLLQVTTQQLENAEHQLRDQRSLAESSHKEIVSLKHELETSKAEVLAGNTRIASNEQQLAAVNQRLATAQSECDSLIRDNTRLKQIAANQIAAPSISGSNNSRGLYASAAPTSAAVVPTIINGGGSVLSGLRHV
jgi:chromosome segregation ATPase